MNKQKHQQHLLYLHSWCILHKDALSWLSNTVVLYSTFHKKPPELPTGTTRINGIFLSEVHLHTNKQGRIIQILMCTHTHTHFVGTYTQYFGRIKLGLSGFPYCTLSLRMSTLVLGRVASSSSFAGTTIHHSLLIASNTSLKLDGSLCNTNKILSCTKLEQQNPGPVNGC